MIVTTLLEYVAFSEDNLQRAVRLLHEIASKYYSVVSISETKVCGFIGEEPRRDKLVVNDTLLEQALDKQTPFVVWDVTSRFGSRPI